VAGQLRFTGFAIAHVYSPSTRRSGLAISTDGSFDMISTRDIVNFWQNPVDYRLCRTFSVQNDQSPAEDRGGPQYKWTNARTLLCPGPSAVRSQLASLPSTNPFSLYSSQTTARIKESKIWRSTKLCSTVHSCERLHARKISRLGTRSANTHFNHCKSLHVVGAQIAMPQHFHR
jgi:hypothetical protein